MSRFRVEVVRGNLTDERTDELVAFWSKHGALAEGTARGRAGEVVCLLRDRAGEVMGVSSVAAGDVALVADRAFWLYRRFLVPGAGDDAEEALVSATYDILDEEPDVPGPRPPRGLCVVIEDQELMRRFPEAVWPGSQLLFVGYSSTGAQVRVRYFERDWSTSPNDLHEGFELHVFGESPAVGPDDVTDLWRRERAIPAAEAERRISEVLLVVTQVRGPAVAVSSAYLRRNPRLGLDFWHYRTFVAAEHRYTSVAAHLVAKSAELLEERFAASRGTSSAAGILMEIENEGIKRHLPGGLWPRAKFTFVGENARGNHVRVRYFPGVLAPPPPARRHS